MNKISKNRFIAVVTAAITMGIASGSALAGGFLDVEFKEAEFSNSLMISNPYWPLNPDGGVTPRTFTYEAETEDECVVNTVFVNGGPPYSTLAGTKTISVDFDGEPKVVTALEVIDIEWIDEKNEEGECMGDLVETEVTLDWYAQDDDGNIWYMGELSRSFDEEDNCDEGDFVRTT